jgi:hypothetical protein
MKKSGSNDYNIGEGIEIETSPSTDTEDNSINSPASSSGSIFSAISDSFNSFKRIIIGNGSPLSEQALTPSRLNALLCNELENDLEFINLRPKPKPYEPKQFLMYKENGNKVMFVAQSCNDVDPKNIREFILGGERNIEDAINDVRITNEYKKAKEENKEIEIFTPLAITRKAYGIKRAHWITTQIKESGDKIQLNIIDSMGTSLGYSFDHITNALSISSISEFTEAVNNDTGDVTVISSPSVSQNLIYKSDQGLDDHTSCGHYVKRYVTDHAREYYSATPKEQVVADHEPKSYTVAPDKTPLANNENKQMRK